MDRVLRCADEITQLYAGFEHLTYDLVYSAGARQEGREVMFFSKGLEIPEPASPSGVTATVVSELRTAAL